MENFGWNFSANPYSEPECMVLSSAAMVTAAEKVQARVRTRDCLWGMVETVAVSDVVYVITFLSPLRGLSEFSICLPTACAPSTSSGQAVGCILSPLCGFPGAAKSGRVSLEVVYGIHAGLEVMREVIYTYGLP